MIGGRRNTTVLFRHEKRPGWEAPKLELERGGEVCGSGVDVVILNSEVDFSEVCQLVKGRVGEW